MAMKYVAAYLLKAIANKGESEPTEADIRQILESVGICVDDELLLDFLKQMEGKNYTELIAAGRKNLESLGGGGGAAAPAAAGAAAGGAAEAAAPEVEEEEEEEDMDFDLFG